MEYDYKFDFIVGNPPYTPVKFLPKKSREFITENFKFSNDIYMTFYEKAMMLISNDSNIAFITPTTMFEEKDFIDSINITYREDLKGNVFTAEILTSLVIVKGI